MVAPVLACDEAADGERKDEKHQLRLSLLQTCSRHAILLEGLATEDVGG